MAPILDSKLEDIPLALLPFLVRRDVVLLRPFAAREWMLFPASGVVLWLFALIMAIILLEGHTSGHLDYALLPAGIAVGAVFLCIPLLVMLFRRRQFMYRHKAFNSGVIKTPDAYLVRLHKDRWSLLPFSGIGRIGLVEGRTCSEGDSQVMYMDVCITFLETFANGQSPLILRDFVRNYPPRYYLDTPEKRRVAAFFEPFFEENELSSYALYASSRSKKPG